MKNEMTANKHKKHGRWKVFSNLNEGLRNKFEKQYEDHCKDNPNPKSMEKFFNDREIIYHGHPLVEVMPITLQEAIGINDATDTTGVINADSKSEDPKV